MRVSAVILAYMRAPELELVLDRLAGLPVDEVVVVDNGLSPDVEVSVARRPGVRLVRPPANVGIAGRNLGARAAHGDLLLMLDDDSYPLPGVVEILRDVFRRSPRLGVAGGLVRDIGPNGEVLRERELGTFDWFFRGGRDGEPPAEGWPAFFFPEGACMARRSAFLEAGGYFEPYFFHTSEVDLATRMLALGWDVRYVPGAVFDHLKAETGRVGYARALPYRVRNQIWYFWLHFPVRIAARRIPAYLAFDLVECCYRRVPLAWADGIRDAWSQRRLISGARRPLPRAVLRRAELNRGRMHLRLLIGQLRRRRAFLRWG